MNIEDFGQANMAMMTFWFGVKDTLPDRVAEPLQNAVSSVIPAESVSHFTEIVYANREEFTADQLEAAADVAEFAGFYRFYGLGDDMRGGKIAAILRGEEVPGDAPAVNSRFSFPEPPEEQPVPEVPDLPPVPEQPEMPE